MICAPCALHAKHLYERKVGPALQRVTFLEGMPGILSVRAAVYKARDQHRRARRTAQVNQLLGISILSHNSLCASEGLVPPHLNLDALLHACLCYDTAEQCISLKLNPRW